MELYDFRINRLEKYEQIKSFECGDKDLNDFLLSAALNHHKELMGVTYLFEFADQIIAYYTLVNDKITHNDVDTKIWNRMSRPLPNQKRRKHYPSVKIARFAVNQSFSNQDWGSKILTDIKYLFTSNNRTGCRFVTVDAYKATLSFYEKNEFDYLTDKDKNEQTRLMFFDLKRFAG